jgi:hypothetical protein
MKVVGIEEHGISPNAFTERIRLRAAGLRAQARRDIFIDARARADAFTCGSSNELPAR